MALIPIGADQPLNTARCADLGVAQVLDAITAMPDAVRAALATMLTEAGYRQAAERLAMRSPPCRGQSILSHCSNSLRQSNSRWYML